MKNIPSIQAKSRQDVIDTTWQKQQELRVLRWLLLLFFFTAFYEFGDPLLQQWAVQGIVVPDAPPDVEKPSFPARRIERLMQIIEKTAKRHSFLRDSLQGWLSEIREVRAPLITRPRDQRLQAQLRDTLVRLWDFTHLPYGPDVTIYAELNDEIERSVRLLRGTLSENNRLPEVKFVQKVLSDLGPVVRDPFHFGTLTGGEQGK